MGRSMSGLRWSGPGWSVAFTNDELIATSAMGTHTFVPDESTRLSLGRHWWRWSLHFGNQPLVRLRRFRRADALEFEQALRMFSLAPLLSAAVAWYAEVSQLIDRSVASRRWITTEAVDALLPARPHPAWRDRVLGHGASPPLSDAQRDAVAFLDVDLEAMVAAANERIMAAELEAQRSFFDTIEASPLTEEQARAVVCFDNRVQVLAAAGSGKTSVMVARAAYAVARDYVAPQKILLLAFNKAAADELHERITARFAAAGIDSSGVRASTFHSFGLSVIGAATGEKPRLARWLDQGEDVRTVMRLVDELRDTSPTFRYRWDLYRLLFSAAPTDLNVDEPDGYNADIRETGYRTFGGEIVKSHSERLIADFLYLNGVDYRYEQPFQIPVADATHSQYCPDFYYPDIDVWHEHWALDRDGNPPAAFDGYAESMAWKRRLHAEHGTKLLESTWAEVMFGDGLAQLETELTRHGLTFDWNPDRTINDEWAKPMKHEDLARFIRTFMAHVKSNSWTREDLDQRLRTELPGLTGFRTGLFLDVYWPIRDAWQQRLAEDGSIDFEDMLTQAADHLESGRASSGYELVLVDEFQDASRARARLVRALVNAPSRFLLAVGDDWQAINRFAGADLSVMTNFEPWFGRGHQHALTTTFRCPQTICDVARTFVSKNPNQFHKPMRSAHDGPGAPITIIPTDAPTVALAEHLSRLSAAVDNGVVPTGDDGTVSVDVLGRYQFERDVLPRRHPANLTVRFRTVHGSKGLEADYIVIPGMATGTYGFPSSITDDPVLALAMPEPDPFPHAEERRLFYVALTRARRGVTIMTPPHRMSPFVVELLEDPNVVSAGGASSEPEVCPVCRQGVLAERRGRYGPFLGCSTFPACNHTRSL